MRECFIHQLQLSSIYCCCCYCRWEMEKWVVRVQTAEHGRAISFSNIQKVNNGNNFLHSKNSELKCIANKRIKNKRGRGGARRRERQRNNSQQHVTDLKRSASVNNNKEKYKVSGLVCAQKKEHAARRCCSRKNNTKCTLVKQQLLCLSECIWWPRKWAKPNDRKKWIRRGFSFEIVLIYSGR